MKVSAAENHWGDALSLLSPNQFEPDPDRVIAKAAFTKLSARSSRLVSCVSTPFRRLI